MNILAVDPGTTQSAIVQYSPDRVGNGGTPSNTTVMQTLIDETQSDLLAIEMVASYGMPVGAEVFETCVWIGRFIQAWYPRRVRIVYRKDVKMTLCGSMKANDANIRQAIIDLYGGKEIAIGKKKSPGSLYGMKGDQWAALAVAITAERAEKIEAGIAK